MSLQFDDAPVYGEMIDALKHLEDQTSYVDADLSSVKYERDSEWGSIDDGLSGKRELTGWSVRQLCRMASIPLTFFKKSTPELAKESFEEWVPQMKTPTVKLAIRTYGKNKEVIRGILPIDYPEIRNSEVLQSIQTCGFPFVVEYAKWLDEVDAPYTRTRFVMEDVSFPLSTGDDLYVGVDVICSELGASPLIVNILLFRHVCRNGAIAVFDQKPYFYYSYTPTISVDIYGVLAAVRERILDDRDKIFEVASRSMKLTLTTDQAKLIVAEMVKGDVINKGIGIKANVQIDKTGASTGWDMVNALTASARSFRDLLRVKYESAAGALLGLTFSRKQSEDSFAATAPDRILPPSFKLP